MNSFQPQSATATLEDRGHSRWNTDASAQPFAIRNERPEIEGLRGLAILSLLAIHCAPGLSRGGAIGVDIFFVVSGYLLTLALWRHQGSDGGWRAFLARRLQRLVPPLVVLLVACLAFATLFMLPADLESLGRSMTWGAGLLTNVDAWQRGVPTDAAIALDPLSHLWQVAVIAQTCVLLALCAWVFRPQPRTMLRLALVSGALSFAFGVLAVERVPDAAFYLLAGRWWELMAGVALALGSNSARGSAGRAIDDRAGLSRLAGKVWAAVAPHLGWAGVACYAMAVLLAGDTTHFPGAWALWPVAGTVSLLAAGPQDAVNRHVLAQPLLRFYGRVSYPLYLWHWPVLCFPLLLGVPLSVDVRVLILLASVVLAAMTHELIEKPIAMLQATRRLSMIALAALAVTAALGAFVSATDGLRFTFPAELQSIPGRGTAFGH